MYMSVNSHYYSLYIDTRTGGYYIQQILVYLNKETATYISSTSIYDKPTSCILHNSDLNIYQHNMDMSITELAAFPISYLKF